MATCGAVSNHIQVCYDIVGQDTAGITVRFYVNTVSWGWNDNQVLSWSGSNGTSGSAGYLASASSGQSKELYRADVGFPLAPGQAVNFSATVSDVAGGGSPTVSGSGAASCTIPSTMSAPTQNWVNQTAASIHYSPPSNTGGCGIDQYLLRMSQDPAMGSYADAPGLGCCDYQWNGLSPNTTYYFWVYAHNAAGYSPVSGRLTVVTPANAPAAPSGLGIARVSDTQQTLTWTNNATAPAPYTSLVVVRSEDGGAFATIATLAGSATSYSDTTTTGNHVYRYNVKASNNGGDSAYATEVGVITTPAAPTSVTAVRGTGNSVNLTWVNNATPAYTVRIEESDGAGGWTAQTSGLASGTTSYTDSAPLAGTTQYRLRADSVGPPALSSAWVTSPSVTVITPPNAPTPVAPSGTALDAAATITYTWVHNPVDGSAQTKRQIQWREVGTGTWTVGSIVSTSSPSVSQGGGTLLNGKTYEWQARTWGAATTGGSDGAGGSPWSASATFTTSAKPTATISSPTNGSTVGTATATVSWAYFDTEGTPQAQWRARLYTRPDLTLLETKSAAGTATTTTFATKVLNGGLYRITVEVQDGAGLWSNVATSDVTVSYLPPALVTTNATYDEDTGSVGIVLTPQAPVGGSTVAASTVDIERSIDGGPWVLIADDIPADSAVVDTQPSIRGENCYRVTVSSATPSTRVQAPVCVTADEGDNGFLTTGSAFDDLLLVMCDLDVSAVTGRAKQTYSFAGRAWPVEFSGESLSQTVAVKGTITGDPTSWADIEAFALTPRIVLWRDPSGRRVYGSLGAVSTALRGGMTFRDVWEASFTITRVDHDG